MNQGSSWVGIGMAVVALGLGGCPSAGPAGSGNSNDNVANGNDNNANDNSSNDNNDNNSNDNGGIEPGVEILVPDEGNLHVPVGQQVTYQANPPASGSHWSAAGVAPVDAGVYDVALEEEQWIHNLEHGYVVLLYDCHGPCQPDLRNDLQTLLGTAPPSELFGNVKLVITPYAGLPFSFTVVAWDRQLHLDSLDQNAILDFYDQFVDQGPEQVP